MRPFWLTSALTLLASAAHAAPLTYDAALIRGPETVVEKRRFEARVPVAPVAAEPAAAALNTAANQVAAEVATWVGK